MSQRSEQLITPGEEPKAGSSVKEWTKYFSEKKDDTSLANVPYESDDDLGDFSSLEEKRSHKRWTNDITEVAVFVGSSVLSLFCAACAAGMSEYGPAQTNQKMVNFIMNLVSEKSKPNWPLDMSISPKYWPGLTPWNIEMFLLAHLTVFFAVKFIGILFEQVPFRQPMKGQEHRVFYESQEKYLESVRNFT